MSSERSQSQSRGRDTFTSTGRGGVGNIKRSDSVSRDRVGDERGREVSPAHPERITHSGRGGAGNVRSPSRDPDTIRKEMDYERVVLEARAQDPLVSTGRGGLGNMRLSSPGRSGSVESRSRSRDPAPGGRFLHSGRSGLLHENHENPSTYEEESPAHNDAHLDGTHRDGKILTDDRRGRSEAKHASGLGSLIDKITGHPTS